MSEEVVGHKTQQVISQADHAGKVVGWVKPRLGQEEEATVRERLIRWRFEHIDESLAYIDELLRELAELGALDTDVVDAIREVRKTVTKLHPMR
jgi:hypothetical protein